MSKHELEGKFNPKDFEDEIYENWEKKGYFKPSNDKSKKPYTIVIPPPNITGRLHMGHALDETLQDILIRYKRMTGFNALWVPGTDHASIATEAKIVAKLKEEGITKEDLGIEEFLKRDIAENNIWISYERKMCCGIGKCGHCKMDDTYICIDGPVFDYSYAKNLID